MPVPNSEKVGSLIDSIYAASLDDSLWSDILVEMSALFGGVGAILVRVRFERGLELTWIQERVPAVEGRWDHYMAYRDLDVRTAYGLSKPAPLVYVDQEFIEERAIERHPFYQDFLATYDLRYTAGSRFPAEDGEFGIINVFRNQAQGPHERAETELMQALVPHLTKACAIDQRLAKARLAERRLREALDRVPEAIFLVEPDGRIVDANHAADLLVRKGDGLSSAQARLSAAHAVARKRLADVIAGAARRELDVSGRALPIPRESGRPLQLLIAPLPQAASRTFPVQSPKPIVMVLVSDPDAAPRPLAERLALLWHLTPAESRLAAALAGGASLKDYAEQHGLTENTVRWTSKSLLAKTDCRRQSQMVRFLTTAAASW
ncbi:MAG: helix-turn-helix transcriptional regulator [Pseudomonadota bacterium]